MKKMTPGIRFTPGRGVEWYMPRNEHGLIVPNNMRIGTEMVSPFDELAVSFGYLLNNSQHRNQLVEWPFFIAMVNNHCVDISVQNLTEKAIEALSFASPVSRATHE